MNAVTVYGGDGDDVYAANNETGTGNVRERATAMKRKREISRKVSWVMPTERGEGGIECGGEAAAGAIEKRCLMWGQKRGREKQQIPIGSGEV